MAIEFHACCIGIESSIHFSKLLIKWDKTMFHSFMFMNLNLLGKTIRTFFTKALLK